MSKIFPIVEKIKNSWKTIYDNVYWTDLWLSNELLQEILSTNLTGIEIGDLPNRTRSKVIKSHICTTLGYPIPKTFEKTKPRFYGQDFDIYIQKSNNLQIWNEEISDKRRYVIIQMLDWRIWKIKVINWIDLAILDTTGTLTIKHQATYSLSGNLAELVWDDTQNLKSIIWDFKWDISKFSPVDKPSSQSLINSRDILALVKPIIWLKFENAWLDQERNRAAELHSLVCKYLWYSNFKDNWQFPDILNQLLEVKLQTSPTIDLWKHCPNSKEKIMTIEDKNIYYEDVRYIIVYWTTKNDMVEITNISIVSGVDFFSRFPQFQGNIVNKKIQLPLPKNFFS